MNSEHDHLVPVTRFCGQPDCSCPELFVDPEASDNQRIVIIDDFSHSIHMSYDQLLDLVKQARSGALLQAVAANMPVDWLLKESA